MYSISRRYEFSAAHRIEGHPKCGRIHGHNYTVTVTLRQRVVGTQGMIMDYADLDREVKPFIDAMDHRYLVSHDNINRKDPYATVAMDLGHACGLPIEHSTAEELAAMIHTLVRGKTSFPASDITVEVIEAPKSTAEYTGE